MQRRAKRLQSAWSSVSTGPGSDQLGPVGPDRFTAVAGFEAAVEKGAIHLQEEGRKWEEGEGFSPWTDWQPNRLLQPKKTDRMKVKVKKRKIEIHFFHMDECFIEAEILVVRVLDSQPNYPWFKPHCPQCPWARRLTLPAHG